MKEEKKEEEAFFYNPSPADGAIDEMAIMQEIAMVENLLAQQREEIKESEAEKPDVAPETDEM